jgi:hypothetical protein
VEHDMSDNNDDDDDDHDDEYDDEYNKNESSSSSGTRLGGGIGVIRGEIEDDDDEVDEYASARKLVERAANREALLKGGSDSGDGALSKTNATTADTASAAASVGSTHQQQQQQLGNDYSNMTLKSDHIARPIWTCPDGTIYLEATHALYTTAYDFLVAIAEPITRPEYIHEYKLTPYSLYAAVATNIDTESIVRVLHRYSKNELPTGVIQFIRECTKRYGKARLVLKYNRYHVESDYPFVLRELLRDELISLARITEDTTTVGETKDNDADGSKTKKNYISIFN